ncbi:MAG: hypothetical protein E7404_05060 [Ruminococcaceae bacterium]|nr:hypothetical protein [Oscillospiraceae bacterium]
MNNFKKDLEKVIILCENELFKRKNNILGESTQEQLEDFIIPELNNLLTMTDKKGFPPKEERFLVSFANAFTVWGWNIQNPTKLFIMLTELNEKYKTLGE